MQNWPEENSGSCGDLTSVRAQVQAPPMGGATGRQEAIKACKRYTGKGSEGWGTQLCRWVLKYIGWLAGWLDEIWLEKACCSGAAAAAAAVAARQADKGQQIWLARMNAPGSSSQLCAESGGEGLLQGTKGAGRRGQAEAECEAGGWRRGKPSPLAVCAEPCGAQKGQQGRKGPRVWPCFSAPELLRPRFADAHAT